jgi:hypothetical protein
MVELLATRIDRGKGAPHTPNRCSGLPVERGFAAFGAGIRRARLALSAIITDRPGTLKTLRLH